jgi:hypothetical protein
VRYCVAEVATVKGQPTMTIKDMEQNLEVSQGEEEEHIMDMLTP